MRAGAYSGGSGRPDPDGNGALISTRTFASGLQAYATWRRRWRIENNGVRELKEGWHLEAASWSYTDATVEEVPVTFTVWHSM